MSWDRDGNLYLATLFLGRRTSSFLKSDNQASCWGRSLHPTPQFSSGCCPNHALKHSQDKAMSKAISSISGVLSSAISKHLRDSEIKLQGHIWMRSQGSAQLSRSQDDIRSPGGAASASLADAVGSAAPPHYVAWLQ